MRKTLFLAALAALTTACFPQTLCSSPESFVEYCQAGDTSCQGHIVDATHWQSGPVLGNWLDYGPEKNILMHFRDAQTGATLASADAIAWNVYINASQSLADSPNQFAPCAGNACEINLAAPDGMYLKNDTCAPYFVYVEVTFAPPVDAGTE